MTTQGRFDGGDPPAGDDRRDGTAPRILPMPAAGAWRPGATVSPLRLCEGIVEELLGGGETRAGVPPVTVSLDLGDAPGLDIDAQRLRRIVEPLLRRSIVAARNSDGVRARRPEVVVTAVAYPDAVEIEFADTGTGLTDGERSGLMARAGAPGVDPDHDGTMLETIGEQARSMGGSLTAIDCPDGGSAVTLRLPLLRAARRRAA